MANVTKNFAKVISATATEANATIDAQHTDYIVNDGAADIWVSFDAPLADNNYEVIKPGEYRNDLKFDYSKIYYKSTSGTVSFRIAGLKRLAGV